MPPQQLDGRLLHGACRSQWSSFPDSAKALVVFHPEVPTTRDPSKCPLCSLYLCASVVNGLGSDCRSKRAPRRHARLRPYLMVFHPEAPITPDPSKRPLCPLSLCASVVNGLGSGCRSKRAPRRHARLRPYLMVFHPEAPITPDPSKCPLCPLYLCASVVNGFGSGCRPKRESLSVTDSAACGGRKNSCESNPLRARGPREPSYRAAQ